MKVWTPRISFGCRTIVNACAARGYHRWSVQTRSLNSEDDNRNLWPLTVNASCGTGSSSCCCAPDPCRNTAYTTPVSAGEWWVDTWQEPTTQFFGWQLKSMVMSDTVDPAEPREVVLQLLLVGSTWAGVQAGRDALRRALSHDGSCSEECNGQTLAWWDCDRGQMVHLDHVRLTGKIETVDTKNTDCTYELVQVVLQSEDGWVRGDWQKANDPLLFEPEPQPNEGCDVPVLQEEVDPFMRALARVGAGTVAPDTAWCAPHAVTRPVCVAIPEATGDIEARVDLYAGSHDLPNVLIELTRCDKPVSYATVARVRAGQTAQITDRAVVCGKPAPGVSGELVADWCTTGTTVVCVYGDATLREDETPRTAPDASVTVYWRRRWL